MKTSRGALDLLACYSDDGDTSEDDKVPGPKVSTKRTHRSDSEDEITPISNKPRLPVPKQFQKQIEETNDAVNHEGRIRSFGHERGNWATFIFIPFSINTSLEELMQLIKESSNLEIHCNNEFHISLTKTVILKYHWIESFISTVAKQIKSVRRFVVMFDSLKIYCNEEQTRTFIGLQIKTGYNSLENLTNILDSCLVEYKLDTFYQDPSFHMSIMWCLGNKTEELNDALPAWNNIFQNVYQNSDPAHWYIDVDSIQCKTGNKYFTFSL